MSRKRYISTELSTDTKIAELAECGLLAPLLFTWAIPHMDDWGRVTGNAREFKLLVCPGLNVTNNDVEDAINRIISARLWVRYEHEGKMCISVMNQNNWFKHQSYISKDKRSDDSKSSFPTPRNTEEHRETPKSTEEEQKLPQNPSSFSLSSSVSVSPSINTYSYYHVDEVNVFKSFEKEGFGKITEMTSEFLIDLETTYTALWVVKAMKAAIKQGVMKISYVEKILKGWKALGHAEPWTLEKEEQPKNNVRPFNKGFSGKQHIPIIADSPKSAPLSDEEKAEMLRMAELLDGDKVSNH